MKTNATVAFRRVATRGISASSSGGRESGSTLPLSGGNTYVGVAISPLSTTIPDMRVPSLTALTGAAALAAVFSLTPSYAHAQGAKGGWITLFDGTSMDHWRGYQEKSMPAGWHIENGTLTKSVSTNDIVTRDQYTNFELELEWKLEKGGNAGIFYRGAESQKKIYMTGPEYQLLDDANAPDGKSRLTSAGADYAIYPSPAGVVKPAGEWNSTRIVANGAHVEHWLNGTKLLEYMLWSPDWEAKVKASKFAQWPSYGRAPKGFIGLQDHGDWVAYRNIRIRPL